MTYECPICYGVNHISRLHCQTCGTTPSDYSVTGKPSVMQEREHLWFIIDTVIALGVDRTERHRTIKRNLRTVPAD